MARKLLAAVGAALLAASVTTAASAQGLPLPQVPAPAQPHEQKPDCSAKGVKAMEEQLASLESLDKAAPETIAMVCQGFDVMAGLMGWKDDEPIQGPLDELARKLLNRSLTPRMVRAMCRQAEGEAGRNIRTEIGALKARLDGCRGV